MNEELRDSGIEFLGKIPWGTHIGLIYSSINDFDVSVSFIKAGILNNELCVWIYSQNTSREEILSLIALRVENSEEYIKRGQLLVIPFDAWYANDVENFNEVRVSRQWVELVAKAVEYGYAGLRAVADTYWLDKCYYRDFSRYESNIGAIISELPFLVICQYNESRIGIGEAADITKNHNYIIIGSSSDRRIIKNTELLVKNAQYEALRKMEMKLREGENKLREQAAVMQAINLVHERAMACDTMEQLGGACLEIIGLATQSSISFIGEIREDGLLHDIASSDTSWTECTMYDKTGLRLPPVKHPIINLCDSVLLDWKCVVTNNPPMQPDSIGMLQGHQKLSSFLGVPFLQGDKVLGVIAVANRNGGYTEKEQRLLEALTPTVLEVLLHKRTEAALRESEERYRHLFEHMHDGFAYSQMLFDEQGRPDDFIYLAVNEAFGKLTGLKDVIGKRVTQVIPRIKELNPELIEIYGRVASVGAPQRFEIDFKPLNLYFLISVYCPHKGYFIAVFEDITERKRAEEALRESEAQAIVVAGELEKKSKFITDFFINISHELKTPLSILMLGIDLLEQKVGKGEGKADISKNIAVMRQNSFRLNRLIANLLDITKLDAGFMEPKWERIDIVDHLARLVKSTEIFAAQKGLQIKVTFNVESMILVTDSFMIERIVLNLLSNAIKHTQAGGSIAARCDVQNDCVTVSVKDSGEGIPDDKKGIIFDRFQQVNTSLARASEGCGIGLALTKSFVELLGGRIAFESTFGAGSEFAVCLPVLQIEVMDQPIEQNGMNMSKRIQMEFSDIM